MTARAAVVLVALALASCRPPESERTRGGGPGGDGGNRRDEIVIREKSAPFQGTPRRSESAEDGR